MNRFKLLGAIVSVLLLLLEVGTTSTAHAKLRPGGPGNNFVTVTTTTGLVGGALAVGCYLAEPCGAVFTAGGIIIGGTAGLAGGLYALTPYGGDPAVMPGDLPNAPVGCGLDCQGAINAAPPSSTGGGVGGGGGGAFEQVNRIAIGGTGHPWRNALHITGKLLPRPDWRGIAVTAVQDNVLAPRFRQLPVARSQPVVHVQPFRGR